MDIVPREMGRPTAYKPEYCEMLVKHMTEGFSFESFGAIAGVSKQTMYTWADKYRDFLDAKKLGEVKSLLWWENEGKKGLWIEKDIDAVGKVITTRTLNTSNWIFQMKNRHQWSDQRNLTVQKEVKVVEEFEREKVRAIPLKELIELVKHNLPEASE